LFARSTSSPGAKAGSSSNSFALKAVADTIEPRGARPFIGRSLEPRERALATLQLDPLEARGQVLEEGYRVFVGLHGPDGQEGCCSHGVGQRRARDSLDKVRRGL
jgi:hypothetical protein